MKHTKLLAILGFSVGLLMVWHFAAAIESTMPHARALTLLALSVGFYMAWNIGANDVSNAMGTSVGSRALTLKQAVILAAILEFAGAFLLGSNVSETMQRGLINPDVFNTLENTQLQLLLGMCGALLGTGVWLQIASFFGWPVSTTHAIVGAIVGFGAVIGGVDAVNWMRVGEVASSWIFSPLLSGMIAFLIFNFLQHRIYFHRDPMLAAKKTYPLLLFIFIFTVSISLLTGGNSQFCVNITATQSVFIATVAGSIGALIAYLVLKRVIIPDIFQRKSKLYSRENLICLEKAVKHLRRVRIGKSDTEELSDMEDILEKTRRIAKKVKTKTDDENELCSEIDFVEKLFVSLQIFSACFIAFAHGANDVANAIGPIAAIIDIINNNGSMSTSSHIPIWLLILGGGGIVIGLATWGWRVIETIGNKITELTPSRGFSAEFGAATTILIASKLGMPISTTHCLVGAVLGVGMAHGIRALNLHTIRDIVLSWIVTIPASACMGVLFYYILSKIFT